MRIRLSFEASDRWNRTRPRQVLGYDLHELFEALADWWHLRRAGRAPQIWLDRGAR